MYVRLQNWLLWHVFVIQVVEPTNKPPKLHPVSLPSGAGEPILTQASGPPQSAGGHWNTPGESKRIPPPVVEMMGLLPPPMTPTLNHDMPLSFGSSDPKNDSLLPFSPDTVNPFPCPPLPPAPQVGLVPLNPTLMGNILDCSSGDEMWIIDCRDCRLY